MPFLLEPNDDVGDLLTLWVERASRKLHRVRTVVEASQHMVECPHRSVLVGGAIPDNAWALLLATVPDGTHVMLWTSEAHTRLPEAPPGRDIHIELLLGLPSVEVLVDHLLDHSRVPVRRFSGVAFR